MTRTELIDILIQRHPHLKDGDTELAVKAVLGALTDALAHGERIEIRSFGSFALHTRPARRGRNPKTGAAVALPVRQIPHFKPGKELRARVIHAPAPTPGT